MIERPFEIPAERLPAGFAEQLDHPPDRPAPARPAATITLVREGDAGLEVLLLRRRRETAFVPGAWVFPGGRVDEADADPALLQRVDGAPGERVPAPAFWLAAIREAFEETGVLLARDASGAWAPDAATTPEVEAWREALMSDRPTLLQVLEGLAARVDLAGVVHNAHWITPVAEPRRYDTRFFLARVPEGREAREDSREMSEAAWLAPRVALERFRGGSLPMVFPTVRTLEDLAGFDTVEGALAHFRGRAVPAIQPRLVRTPRGVGIEVDHEGSTSR